MSCAPYSKLVQHKLRGQMMDPTFLSERTWSSLIFLACNMRQFRLPWHCKLFELFLSLLLALSLSLSLSLSFSIPSLLPLFQFSQHGFFFIFLARNDWGVQQQLQIFQPRVHQPKESADFGWALGPHQQKEQIWRKTWIFHDASKNPRNDSRWEQSDNKWQGTQYYNVLRQGPRSQSQLLCEHQT